MKICGDGSRKANVERYGKLLPRFKDGLVKMETKIFHIYENDDISTSCFQFEFELKKQIESKT